MRIETVESLHQVEPGLWNAVVGPDDFYQSHEWLLSIERDRTADQRYLMAFLGDRLLGALPVYHVKFEGNGSYKPERFCALLGVEGRYLIAGARRCYRGTVLLESGLTGQVRADMAATIVRAALGEAAEHDLNGVILPFMPTDMLECLGRVLPLRAAFESAEGVLPDIGSGIEAYLSRLSHSRRHKVRREIRDFAAAEWRIGAERLADILGDAARLVSEVEQRHGRSTPDFLLKRVFAWQAAAVGHRAVVLTCRDHEGSLVACNIFYTWDDVLYGRAFGIDYQRCRSFEYFNLAFYAAIEYAAAHGLERIHLGVEPSLAKLHRGVIASPLWTAVVHVAPMSEPPGIHIVDRDAMQRWALRFRQDIPRAFPLGQWKFPALA